MARLSLSGARPRGACIAIAALAAGVLVAAGPAGAVLYKWIDANGRVSYSDQPPPANVKAEIVSGAPVASAPEAVREMANQQLDQKKREAQRVADQKTAQKARVDTAMREQECVELRGKLKIYQSRIPVIARLNEQGEAVYLDETEQNNMRERIEAQIRERCNG